MFRSVIAVAIGLAVLAIALTACSTVTPVQQQAAVVERASYDLNCDPGKIELTYLQTRMYGAKGCRRQQNYVVDGTMVYKEGMEPPRYYYDNPRMGFGLGVGHYHSRYYR